MPPNRQDAVFLPSPELLSGYCGLRVHPCDTACVPYTWKQVLAYYRCERKAEAVWREAYVHKDDGGVIYWVHLKIGKDSRWALAGYLRQQCGYFDGYFRFGHRKDTAIVSLVEVIGPDIEVWVAKALLDHFASWHTSKSLIHADDGVLTICDLLRMEYVLQNVVAPLRLQEWQKGRESF